MKSAASYYYSGCENYENYQPHFLDCCSLCQRYITPNSDIFMYRGDTPFCSQECRQEQIEMDEAEERRSRASSKSKRSSSLARSQSKDSSKECDTNKAVRTGTTVAVA